MEKITSTYLKAITDRSKVSRAYRSYQFVGLEIAMILDDTAHKSLYIKLAKDNDPDRLLALAKSVKEKRHVTNRGAYFMRLLKEERTRRSSPTAL